MLSAIAEAKKQIATLPQSTLETANGIVNNSGKLGLLLIFDLGHYSPLTISLNWQVSPANPCFT